MSLRLSIRASLLSICCSTPAFAQNLPATPTAATPPAIKPQIPPAAASEPAHRAQVGFTTGLLTVNADNSSLNQILRDISRLTGMKITGGVNDERVYGSYGPDDISTLLNTLLRGTGSNVLLVFDASQRAQELVLTPRGGGPTPPNPNASRGRDEDDLPPQLTRHMPAPQAGQAPLPSQSPAAQPNPNPPAAQPADHPTPAAATTQQSPNGVSTPQQIYDQLMKLKQQQQQSAPANPPE